MTSFLQLPTWKRVRCVKWTSSQHPRGESPVLDGFALARQHREARTNRTASGPPIFPARYASAVAYVGRYDNLKVDLIWDKSNGQSRPNYFGFEASDAEGDAAESSGRLSGLAIEGLAMMPGSTNGAYVAFRAPIVSATNRTHALIVPVLNFATLASSNGGPPGLNDF